MHSGPASCSSSADDLAMHFSLYSQPAPRSSGFKHCSTSGANHREVPKEMLLSACLTGSPPRSMTRVDDICLQSTGRHTRSSETLIPSSTVIRMLDAIKTDVRLLKRARNEENAHRLRTVTSIKPKATTPSSLRARLNHIECTLCEIEGCLEGMHERLDSSENRLLHHFGPR